MTPSILKLSHDAKCRYAECLILFFYYGECYYADCRYAELF
jgi:hypothetical protein